MKPRTAVYMRVSTKQQNVASQTQLIQHWLAGHRIEDAKWYIDQGESGAHLVRPRFQELQRGIFDGLHHQVVMYSLDRFSRCMVDGLVELDKWRKAGVRMVFIDDMLEIDGKESDPLGDLFIKIMVSVRLAFAEAEREKMKRRQTHGFKAAMKRAAQARAMHRDGSTVEQIADELKTTPAKVRKMVAAADGKVWWNQNRPPGYRKADPAKVFELRDRQQKSFPVIAAQLGITTGTARKYYLEQLKKRQPHRLRRGFAEKKLDT